MRRFLFAVGALLLCVLVLALTWRTLAVLVMSVGAFRFMLRRARGGLTERRPRSSVAGLMEGSALLIAATRRWTR